MKKLIIFFAFMFFLSLPAFAENEEKYSSIREELPNSIGIGLGIMPFIDIYYDRAINKNISLGVNYSNSAQNGFYGHIRYYFFDEKTYNSDIYSESLLGFGIEGLNMFSIRNNTVNLTQLIGHEYRNKNGFVFNIAGGAGVYVAPDLSGFFSISGKVTFGYAF